MKFFVHSLGCKMNWLDARHAAAALSNAGNEEVAKPNEAELVVVATCTVTAAADRKSRAEVSRFLRAGKRVVAFSCSTIIFKKEWREKFPEIEIAGDIAELFKILELEPPREISTGVRSRLPIAVQTGCDCGCTFCLTKVARGPSRNRETAEILADIRHAESLGVREITLTGINLAAFGCSSTLRPAESKLPELLAEILEETEIPRVRLSSLGPQFLDDRFFEIFANERICDHLHLSVQSGSDEILKKMARPYTREKLFEIAERAREIRPHFALAADVIVGFPFEEEVDFLDTLDLAEKIKFAKLHVFPFSPREKTAAANFEFQVDARVKKTRAGKLRELAARRRREFLEANFGRQLSVLAEHDGTALSTNYIRVATPQLAENEIAEIELTPKNLSRDKFE